MKVRRRLALPAVAFVAALAPFAMGPQSCGPLPATISISPANGATVDVFSVPLFVRLFNVDDATIQILVDGQDRSAEFARKIVAATTDATATLVLGAGPHTVAASATGPAGPVNAASTFTVVPPPYFVPNDVVAGILPLGAAGTVRGEVTGVTYTIPNPGAGSCAGRDPGSHRYVLLKVTAIGGLSQGQAEWGVAMRLSQTQLEVERTPLPYPGDVVEAAGTVTQETIRGEARYVLNPVTDFTLVSSPNPVLADVGEPCALDMDCRDDLLCNRTTLVCETFARLDWFSDPRGVNGACDVDADCPAGQYCDPSYVTKNQSTEDPMYGVWHLRSRDTGRHLCQVYDRNTAPVEEVCPRAVTVDDFLGGRFKEGKEVCLEGTSFVSVFNPGDLDVHAQMTVARPLVFPEGDPPVIVVQAATENTAPMRDPAHPLGPLADLPAFTKLRVLGTVKYDCDHFWYEMHPYKWFKAVP